MDVVDEAVIARPVGPLRRFVAAHHGYRQRGLAPATHLGMPSPYLTLIFTLDEPLHLARHVDPRRPPGAYDALVGGLHDSPALVAHAGAQSGVQLRVSPLAARALFGMPAGELAGTDDHLSNVLGPLAGQALDRLRGAGTWADRFAALDDVLGSALDEDRMPPPEIVRAWSVLTSSGGRASLRRIAQEVGWSERHLRAKFRQEIGLTPKIAARVIRFHRARRSLEHDVRAGRANLAALSAAAGYFDQAHLVRDWRQFTGLPPSKWINHEFRNFQAAPLLVGAASLHD